MQCILHTSSSFAIGVFCVLNIRSRSMCDRFSGKMRWAVLFLFVSVCWDAQVEARKNPKSGKPEPPRPAPKAKTRATSEQPAVNNPPPVILSPRLAGQLPDGTIVEKLEDGTFHITPAKTNPQQPMPDFGEVQQPRVSLGEDRGFVNPADSFPVSKPNSHTPSLRPKKRKKRMPSVTISINNGADQEDDEEPRSRGRGRDRDRDFDREREMDRDVDRDSYQSQDAISATMNTLDKLTDPSRVQEENLEPLFLDNNNMGNNGMGMGMGVNGMDSSMSGMPSNGMTMGDNNMGMSGNGVMPLSGTSYTDDTTVGGQTTGTTVSEDLFGDAGGGVPPSTGEVMPYAGGPPGGLSLAPNPEYLANPTPLESTDSITLRDDAKNVPPSNVDLGQNGQMLERTTIEQIPATALAALQQQEAAAGMVPGQGVAGDLPIDLMDTSKAGVLEKKVTEDIPLSALLEEKKMQAIANEVPPQLLNTTANTLLPNDKATEADGAPAVALVEVPQQADSPAGLASVEAMNLTSLFNVTPHITESPPIENLRHKAEMNDLEQNNQMLIESLITGLFALSGVLTFMAVCSPFLWCCSTTVNKRK